MTINRRKIGPQAVRADTKRKIADDDTRTAVGNAKMRENEEMRKRGGQRGRRGSSSRGKADEAQGDREGS